MDAHPIDLRWMLAHPRSQCSLLFASEQTRGAVAVSMKSLSAIVCITLACSTTMA
jgi:hypothetical protein